MNAKTFETIQREVSIAYSDCWEYAPEDYERNLDFRASAPIPLKYARGIMERFCESYNNFEAALLEDSIFEPFESNAEMQVQIAREGSVCMYFYGINEDADLKKLASHLNADEADWDGDCVRVWWD